MMTLVTPELPEYYQPGATLLLDLEPDKTPLSLRVLRAFTPFTMGQVILVELDPGKNSSAYLSLPQMFILKVFDPRFYSHRLLEGSRPARPWTLEAETTAAAARKEQNRGRDPDFVPWPRPANDDAPGWEEWYYQQAEAQYHAEISAYDRLKILQVTTLVHCYGTGLLQLPQRAIVPHAILLEFIPDAKTLDQVDPKVVSANLIRSLLETAKEFGRLGVVHTDFHEGNILFSPGDQPVRAVIIDFGHSGVREDENDEEWEDIVDSNRDPIVMRKILQLFLGDVVLLEQPTSWSGAFVDCKHFLPIKAFSYSPVALKSLLLERTYRPCENGICISSASELRSIVLKVDGSLRNLTRSLRGTRQQLTPQLNTYVTVLNACITKFLLSDSTATLHPR